MNRTRIKFCGMTRPDDIHLACALGVDAIGFVFASQSSRCLAVDQIASLRLAISPWVTVVALFMDQSEAEVNTINALLQPTWLQFHGAEDDAFCRRFKLPFFKTLPMSGNAEDPVIAAKRFPSAAAFLLDGHAPGQSGGRGEAYEWSLAPSLGKPVLLAGGLRPDNVASALTLVRPYAVDVSSGIESSVGCKDGKKMQQFIEEVRCADAKLQQSCQSSNG